MAPIGEAYFPPLDRCFSGEYQLLSWETCYVALSQLEGASNNVSLKRFLTDSQTVSLLVRSIAPYPTPNDQSKSSFETKTSAINVTPPSHARYNITQIQEDTLWLSKEANIDEVSALRIAVLEWQTQPAAQLLRGSSVVSVSSSNGANGNIGGPSFLNEDPNPISARFSPPEQTTFNDEDEVLRKRRLIGILLSERRFMLKCSEHILAYAICVAETEVATAATAQKERSSDWLNAVGLDLLSHWAPESAKKGMQKDSKSSFMVEAIGGVRSRLEALRYGSGWSIFEDAPREFEISWGVNQIVEVLHIMQIIQYLLQTSASIMQPEMVLPWFRLMAECGFFEGFQLPYPGIQTAHNIPLQSLAGLISLSLLNVSLTLELLTTSSTTSQSASNSIDPAPYILHQSAANEINDLLISVAPSVAASPTVLAWSIITQTLRETALKTRDSRELRQSIRSADRYGAGDSSDTDGAERSSVRNMSAIRRRSSTSSDTSQQSTLLEEINDTLQITAVHGDPIAYLAKQAVEDGKVFKVLIAIAVDFCTPFGFEHGGFADQKMRKCLLDLVRASVEFVDYQPALILATMAVITGSERYWEQVDRSSDFCLKGPAVLLRQDEVLKRRIFLMALARFPYESMPFLQLCRALAYQHSSYGDVTGVWLNLESLDTFTCMLPPDYQGYKTIREDEEADFIELIEDFDFDIHAGPTSSKIGPHSTPLLLQYPKTRAASSAFIRLPRGTQGQIISNGKPLVVAWNYEYSALTYIGRVLQCASVGVYSNVSANSAISSDIVSEAISFITIMLLSATKDTSAERDPTSILDSASFILGQASDGLERNQDIISVTFQIFENELYKPQKATEGQASLDVLIQCVHFAYALLPIMPDRVWPFLGRSSLLGVGEEGGRLNAIISSYEIVAGRFGFLLGCVRLFDALIEDVVVNAVSRRMPTKAVTRFGSINPLGTGVSQLIMEKVLISLQRTMIDVIGSIRNWRFESEEDRAEIAYWLYNTFEKLLNYSYRVNDDLNPSSKLTSALLPAANIILETYLSGPKTELAINSILQVCFEGLIAPSTSMPSRGTKYVTIQSTAALRFLHTLVQVNVYLQPNLSQLKGHLFKAAKLFARLFTAHEAYKLPVINLFDALIRSATPKEEKPPSLLGYLGQEGAHCFLEVLAVFDQPLNELALGIAIWRLLAAIVSAQQQWFAQIILTGVTPRASVKAQLNPSLKDAGRTEPIFSIALHNLRNIERLEPRRALAMLEFVALAADFWPSALTIIEGQISFLRTISEYAARISTLANPDRDAPHKITFDYNRLRMAAHIADILAMYTRRTQQVGNLKFPKMLIPHLIHLCKNVITMPSYNRSLHTNLRQNFATKFEGCSLTDFKRTRITPATLGNSYFYDFELANKILAYEPAWVGKRNQGFAEEFRKANLNLSVVEAQIALFRSWKSLLIELSAPLATDEKFQKIMAQIASDCLRANTDNTLPETFFESLTEWRADLAFAMLEGLNQTKSALPEVNDILSVAWGALRSHNGELGAALEAKDAGYHRMLLKILYLAVQIYTFAVTSNSPGPQAAAKEPPTELWSAAANTTTRVVLEIISKVIAQGFLSLTTLIHDSPHLVHPSDFYLLTALLRSCFRIPGLTHNSEHLLNAFADTQIPRCAATLLSWSDQFASSTSGDPIYGEVSTLFLLELSTVPVLAECLAVEGVLSHVLTTNLVRLLQKRAFGPSDRPPRMYAIWSRCILPLLLNILHSVGPAIAAEVAAALNTFPFQLQRASEAFSASSNLAGNAFVDSDITLSMAQEAHSLALIISILRTFRAAGASAAIVASQIENVKWDAAQVKEDVEGWLQRRGPLKERIVPSNEREELWARMRPKNEGIWESRLEEKVMEELRGVVCVLGGG